MIFKNILHRLKVEWQLIKLVYRYDVLIEKAVTVKYIDSISFGRHCTLQSGVYLYGSRAGKTVYFGDYVVIAGGTIILGEGGVEIGDYTHLGPRVVLTTQYGDSSSNPLSANPNIKYSRVRLGRGCWIGSGTVIMPGSILGEGCIVAPNSVVFGCWRDGSILSGNPARPKFQKS
jgi:acetyltransferase-like isoleucine patch superfamily enzyme